MTPSYPTERFGLHFLPIFDTYLQNAAHLIALLNHLDDPDAATDVGDESLAVVREMEASGIVNFRARREHLFGLTLEAYVAAGKIGALPEIIFENLDPDMRGSACDSPQMHEVAADCLRRAPATLEGRDDDAVRQYRRRRSTRPSTPGEELRPAGRGSGHHGSHGAIGRAMSKMTIKTEGDKHVVVTRRFAASPEAVYRAHTEPRLIQKWLLGPDGWTMPVCVNEPQPGGKARYEWSDGKGGGFHLTGEYLELIPFSRIVMWNGCTCPNRRRNRPVLAAADETGIIVAGKDAGVSFGDPGVASFF